MKIGIVLLLICIFFGFEEGVASEAIGSNKKESALFGEVFNCFAHRLQVLPDNRDLIIDKMIENGGLEKNLSTRTMFLGVITTVIKKYALQEGAVVSTDAVADEIVLGIDEIVRANRMKNVPVENKGWLKKNYGWLVAGGAAVAILLGYVLLSLKWKREAAEVERQERLEVLKKEREKIIKNINEVKEREAKEIARIEKERKEREQQLRREKKERAEQLKREENEMKQFVNQLFNQQREHERQQQLNRFGMQFAHGLMRKHYGW